MREVTDILLKNRLKNEVVSAKFIDGVTGDEIAAAQEAWSKLLIEGKHEHAHWDWNKKFQNTLVARASHRVFGIHADDQIQGLLIAKTAFQNCRIEEQKNKPLVYVDYLASAPWNSPDVVEDPKYAGVGKVLIRAAIQLSIEEEFSGRIGLHSLPQAESYYRKICGMTDLGPDEHYSKLVYFEMTSTQSGKFING